MFCTSNSIPYTCFTELNSIGLPRAAPIAILHIGLFYIAKCVSMLGILPAPHDAKFTNSAYTAWHITGIFSFIPTIAMSIYTVCSLYISGNADDMWGLQSTQYPISEMNANFIMCICTELVLTTIHGISEREMLVHHFICLFITMLFEYTRYCPILFAGMLMMESSTPMLNISLLSLGFLGSQSTVTIACFVVFAAMFFMFRVVLSTLIFLHFFWVSHTIPVSNLMVNIYAISLMAILCMQYTWANKIRVLCRNKIMKIH